MPAAVVVGVASSEQYRYGETQLEKSDSSAFGTKNEQFIFEELLPMLRKQYQALDFTLLIGHSRYGYFCSYLLSKRYEEIQAVIALSPVFSQTNSNLLPDLRGIYEQFSRKRHLYYRFGIGSDYPEEFAKVQKLLQKIPAKKKEKIDFKGMLFPEADHNATPGISIASALYEIFAYWSSQQNIFSRKEQPHTGLAALQQNIAAHYGAPLKFSIGTLNGKGWQFFNEQKYAQAIAAWEQCVEAYPLFAEAYLYIIYAQKELQEDYSATLQKLEESLRLTQLYSAEELAELQEEIKSLKP